MKRHMRAVTIFLLVLIVLGLIVPMGPHSLATAGDQKNKGRKYTVKGSKMKSGQEVTARIRNLKEHNKDVRAAFNTFEKRGRTPKFDDALLINATLEPSSLAVNNTRSSLFRKASFTQEQTTISGNGYELILVPSVVIDGEWQGTAIATKYDEYGYVVDQYASNIVTVPDSEGNTAAVYEVRYDNGIPYLQHEPGMFTGFTLGLTIQEHQYTYGAPPPLDLQSWQFPSTEVEQQYYDYYPEQQQFQREQMLEQQVSQWKGAVYKPATFRSRAFYSRASFQARSDRAASREQLRQFCGNPNGCGPGPGAMFTPRQKQFLLQGGLACAGAAMSCRGNPQCSAWACAGGFVSQLYVLF